MGIIESILGFFTATLATVGTFGALIIGVILLVLLVFALSLPVKLIYNGICGAVILWLVNLLGGIMGFHMEITVWKALIAGIFGIPGTVVIILLEMF